mmetsp:Transcript_28579/g.71826  ORF Transcript_28579/g.71826 Transcript_28579/m.71826 type:complete len:215 (-) Transcript_28579:1408-2052(-)
MFSFAPQVRQLHRASVRTHVCRGSSLGPSLLQDLLRGQIEVPPQTVDPVLELLRLLGVACLRNREQIVVPIGMILSQGDQAQAIFVAQDPASQALIDLVPPLPFPRVNVRQGNNLELLGGRREDEDETERRLQPTLQEPCIKTLPCGILCGRRQIQLPAGVESQAVKVGLLVLAPNPGRRGLWKKLCYGQSNESETTLLSQARQARDEVDHVNG